MKNEISSCFGQGSAFEPEKSVIRDFGGGSQNVREKIGNVKNSEIIQFLSYERSVESQRQIVENGILFEIPKIITQGTFFKLIQHALATFHINQIHMRQF